MRTTALVGSRGFSATVIQRIVAQLSFGQLKTSLVENLWFQTLINTHYWGFVVVCYVAVTNSYTTVDIVCLCSSPGPI